ncbi:hypothetical protein LCGC14_2985150 [marine sediment metagenome]|uniref:Uncharacterized protein n=1 Tax=marine sediment metagenome TaxID=412755 RepID=A0A0F8X6B2_9ZZZZ
MAYKDKNKQREAVRDAARRRRAREKSITAEARVEPTEVSPEVVPNESGCETPEGRVQAVPDRYGSQDCQCLHCAVNKRKGGKHTINHWSYKPAHELEKNEINRICLLGDVDYQGVMQGSEVA